MYNQRFMNPSDIFLIAILSGYFFIFTTNVVESIEIVIKDQGIGYINEGDIAMIFYVTLENKCKQDLEVVVDMVKCCETTNPSEIECNYMLLIGGYMGVLAASKVKNVTLIYPNLYLENRQGICTVAVSYRNEFKKKEITREIHFDTAKYCTSTNKCDTTDLSPSDNCSPVDCLIKYSGEKSYFDSKCRSCKTAPCCNSQVHSCMPDIIYSPFSNKCIKLKNLICKEELKAIENNMTDSSCVQNLMGNIRCHKGIIKDGECTCFEGWSTTTYDEEIYQPSLAQYHMCNVQLGNWHCVNKSKVKLTVILIILFAITLASKILLLMCVLNWCYKHFHKPPNVCMRYNSSDDELLLLCDNIGTLDKCVCEKEKQPSPSATREASQLQAQTVSVTYYPCPSSAKGTTDNKSSTSTKGSSVAISFESRTTEDGSKTTENSDEVEVEEDYEIEFFDEEEEEEEEDDMDQLTVEEDKKTNSVTESTRTPSKKSSTVSSTQDPTEEPTENSENILVSKSSTDAKND